MMAKDFRSNLNKTTRYQTEPRSLNTLFNQ